MSLATGSRALECGQTLRAPEELEVQRFRQQLRVPRAGSGSRVVERATVQARHSHALAPVGGLRAFAACGRLSALAVSRCPRVPGAELALARTQRRVADVTPSAVEANTGSRTVASAPTRLSPPSPVRLAAVAALSAESRCTRHPCPGAAGAGRSRPVAEGGRVAVHALLVLEAGSRKPEVGVWAGPRGGASHPRPAPRRPGRPSACRHFTPALPPSRGLLPVSWCLSPRPDVSFL